MKDEAMTVEQRLEALEKRIEQVAAIANLPRKPGDISAAVAQAKVAVSDAEARVQLVADASYIRFENDLAELRRELVNAHSNLRKELQAIRQEVREYEARTNETIKNAVDVALVQTLEDYKVLKNGAPSSDYFAHEIRNIVAEELVKS
jgi:hypothetical protein